MLLKGKKGEGELVGSTILTIVVLLMLAFVIGYAITQILYRVFG